MEPPTEQMNTWERVRAQLRRRYSLLERELITLLLIGLAVLGVSISTPTDQLLYYGSLIVDFPRVQEATDPDLVLPSLAIDRVTKGSPAYGFHVMMLPPASKQRYPLDEVQVRCDDDMPAPLAVSNRAFRMGLREHCRFRLPPHPPADPLTAVGDVTNEDIAQRRFYFASIPPNEILIRCDRLLPLSAAKSDRGFSAWVKANCTFVARWAP